MIILASKSPRRKEILENLGFEYRCVPAETDETPVEGMSPADTVMLFSQRKAFAVKDEAGNGDVVLGMDTMVCIDGELLGKP
ncbi:MAG: Maf family protein, partial [Clostridia bacterium]|nr:Maf family protein [Clostridia bacterium]